MNRKRGQSSLELLILMPMLILVLGFFWVGFPADSGSSRIPSLAELMNKGALACDQVQAARSSFVENPNRARAKQLCRASKAEAFQVSRGHAPQAAGGIAE